MQLPKLLSFSNALNGMKHRQDGYNLATTGMLPNFGKTASGSATAQVSSVSPVSTVLDVASARLKRIAAAAKRVLLKPEEPQPFAASQEKKSYQVFRRLTVHDEVRHVCPIEGQGEPTAEALTDNQELGKQIKPTLWDKLSGLRSVATFERVEVVSPEVAAQSGAGESAHAAASPFAATCPGKPEKNQIADAFEKRMAEKKAVAPVVAKPATAVVHSAAKPEMKESVPAKLRAAIFGRSKRNAAQPAVQGEFALDNVRPIRNDLSDADLEVVSAEAKVGTGILQTATVEKATTTAATSRRGFTQKTDSAINSIAEAPTNAEQAPELIARV